ncbi:MAG TPA: tripartite tricarboxylate transporter substrate-binding protein [Xanthobacteraceae bacterium]|nr:tripartite tricarboxylate transporter substrate-binding protein [Xanthobacteraceae bacterium]
MLPRNLCLPTLVGAALLALGANATAQDFPAHPITMVVPFPAGGPTDVIARVVAERMRVSLGQPVVIENATGAAGSIGVGRVARAPSDGYTLSFGTWSTHVVNAATLTLAYDTLGDFEPVALVALSPMVMTASKAFPAGNLKEAIAWLAANPDKAVIGTAGVGSSPHIAGMFFEKETGTRLRFVPYRGVGPAMQDMLAGRVDLMIDLVANALPQLRAGNVKAFAVLSKNRLGVAPDLPTVDEAGAPGLYVASWQAIWAPKGTPAAVIDKLNAAVVDSLADAQVVARLSDMAQDIPARNEQTPQALGALQRAEMAKWLPIVKTAAVKPD